MRCMFCRTDKHSIDECTKVDYCESGEHYVEIENMWDGFSECYSCTTNEEYSFFNNVPMEYTLKIKKKEIKLSEVYKLLDRESKFYKNFSNTYKIYEKKIC